jgi:hypothetical protein
MEIIFVIIQRISRGRNRIEGQQMLLLDQQEGILIPPLLLVTRCAAFDSLSMAMPLWQRVHV